MYYPNRFGLSKELAKVISNIISQTEGVDYICKTMIVTIPEHKGVVFKLPFDSKCFNGPGLMNLHGPEIQAICDKY